MLIEYCMIAHKAKKQLVTTHKMPMTGDNWDNM